MTDTLTDVSGGERAALPLGPRPVPLRLERMAQLSPARTLVLERLCAFGRPAGVTEIAHACGQHPNTVREHLDSLIRAGMATRSTAPAKGRGRPAILYLAESLESTIPQLQEYASISATLSAYVRSSCPSPTETGRTAGTTLGETLARSTEPSREAADADVLQLLHDRGYEPEVTADGSIHLRRCPVLAAARGYPEVVCALHEGVLVGIYRAHRIEGPFPVIEHLAIPGACIVRLPSAQADATD